ncbi:hypothetical protein BT96DRAFT_923330 [Gymnopus androsaceus JB14]|uniref:Uncharacterized protein n=1 Tax=Gymnopus androsaceus JB14 TaxID=1447944 RepID=A0A6A4H9K1_9AGAR|nr:hypothetical protein BT96DRAFT_923330 [Gymnopus androsaceus JB14]
MGSRGGTNAQVADEIVHHCRIMAYNGRSNLLEEKRAVHQAYSACWGGCAGDVDDDPDFYDVSQAVRDRVQVCMELMDELPEEELVKVMKALKTYKGPLDGEDMVGEHHRPSRRASPRNATTLLQRKKFIRGIYDEYNSEDPEIPKEVQSRLDSIHFLLSNLSKGFLQDVRKEFKKSSGYYGSATDTNKELTQGLYDHCQKLAEGGADLEDEEGIVEGIYKQCYRE